MDNGSSSSGDESADAHDEDSGVHRDIRRPAAAAAAGNATPCELLAANGAQSKDTEAAAQWHRNRYRRWQEERQHAEPGLRAALLRLALASLMQPRLAADAPTGTKDLPGDVVGVVGDAVESALRFCGVLAGHTGPVTSAAFSPEGQKIVSASNDKTVRVWSAATGDCEQTMTGHTSTVFSAAFSPDGLKIVSASGDYRGDHNTVRIWSVVTGECEQSMTGHTGGVSSAGFSSEGRQIVSASRDNTVRVWDAAGAGS
jgi:WD40 repeat protein